MNIKVTNRKWPTVAQKRTFTRLAKHVMNHYPKDVALHMAVRGAFRSMDEAASKLAKASTKKRRTARKATPKRRTARKAAPKRRTARKAAPKRRTARRATPKRRTRRRAS